MRKVLELPAFRRLLAVTTLNEIAMSVGAVALALLVYHRTGSAFGATAFFLCAEFGPAFFSPLLVARLDQGSVRRVLGLLYALEGLIFLVIALSLGRLSVAAILALVLLDGTLGVAARVLARAAWTSITSPIGLLREANALIQTSRSICYLVGPALGGALVVAGGTRAALFTDVFAFALMTATMATAHGLPEAVAKRSPSAGRLREAFAKIRTAPLLRRLVGLQALGMLFFTITIPVDVVLAQHTLHAGAGGYGVLLAAWGGGAILGSAAYARWRTLPSRILMTYGTLLMGGGFLMMALAPIIGVAIAGAAVAGVGAGIQGAAMRAALQEATPRQWMAPILSLNESVFQAVPGAGMLLGGAIAALAGARTALAVAAGGSLFVATVIWLRLEVGTQHVASADVDDPGAEPDPEPALATPASRP
jgi:Transmembrane secretion effector